MGAYLDAVRLPGVARLFLSGSLARAPLGMTSLAMLLLARSDGYSYGIAGAALAALGLANATTAPILGVLVDRSGQFAVLAVSSYLQAGVLCVFAIAGPRHSAAMFVLLATLAGALVPPTSACVRALLPRIVDDAVQRERLYAIDAIATESSFTLGPLIVALVVGIASPEAAIAAAGVCSIAGTTWFMTSKLSRSWRPEVLRDQRAGVSALSTSSLRVVLLSVLLLGVCMGTCEVGIAAVALHLGGHSLAGVLVALWSIGSLLGGVMYGARTWAIPAQERYWLLVAAVAATTIPLAAGSSVWAAAVLSALAGVFLAPTVACQNSLIMQVAPAAVITEAFTSNTSGLYAGMAAGSGLGGLLIGCLGFRGPIMLSVLVATVASAGAWRWKRRVVAAPGSPQAQVVA